VPLSADPYGGSLVCATRSLTVGVGRCWCVRRTRRGGAGGVGPFVVLVGAEVVLACLSALVGAVLVAFVLVLVACLLF
jgi:hypothetical protein